MMTRYGCWVVAGWALLGSASWAQVGPGQSPLPTKEAVLFATLDGMVAALNAHDVEGFVKGLAENVEVSVHSIGTPGTAYSRDQVRQELMMNPLWGGGEFALKLPRERVKWGIVGRRAMAVADFDMTMGGRVLRPRFIVQAEQALDRTWSVTRLTEAENSPWKEEAPPVPQEGVYIMVGFDLAEGMTEEDLQEAIGEKALESFLQNPSVVSMRTFKAMPLPVGFEPFPAYLICIGLRSAEDLQALGMDPQAQDVQRGLEEITRNLRVSIYTPGSAMSPEGRTLTVP